MNEAVKVYAEMVRCWEATKKTKSEKLKNDYYKHIKDEKKQLLMYCQYRHIDLKDVVKKYNENKQTKG